MPRCIVFGPRGIDVISIVAREYPRATVTKFDEDGGITGIFPEDPKVRLTAGGNHPKTFQRQANGRKIKIPNTHPCSFFRRCNRLERKSSP